MLELGLMTCCKCNKSINSCLATLIFNPDTNLYFLIPFFQQFERDIPVISKCWFPSYSTNYQQSGHTNRYWFQFHTANEQPRKFTHQYWPRWDHGTFKYPGYVKRCHAAINSEKFNPNEQVGRWVGDDHSGWVLQYYKLWCCYCTLISFRCDSCCMVAKSFN